MKNMNAKKVIFFLFVAVFFLPAAYADVIYFEGGAELEGNILRENENNVLIEVSGGIVSFGRDGIVWVKKDEKENVSRKMWLLEEIVKAEEEKKRILLRTVYGNDAVKSGPLPKTEIIRRVIELAKKISLGGGVTKNGRAVLDDSLTDFSEDIAGGRQIKKGSLKISGWLKLDDLDNVSFRDIIDYYAGTVETKKRKPDGKNIR